MVPCTRLFVEVGVTSRTAVGLRNMLSEEARKVSQESLLIRKIRAGSFVTLFFSFFPPVRCPEWTCPSPSFSTTPLWHPLLLPA